MKSVECGGAGPRWTPGDGSSPRRAALDARLSSGLRLLLATVSPLIWAIDPTDQVEAWRPFATTVLAGFFVYSAATYFAAAGGRRLAPPRALPWIDVGWSTLLISFSQGTSSIYFQLYLFAIVCAAFQFGFRDAAGVIAASVFSFSVVGGLTSPSGPSFELDRTLIRPAYLLVLGYLIARVGEHELRLRDRLEFLRRVASLSNPRFGTGHMVARLASTLREFHRADSCRVVVQEQSGECWMRSSSGTAERGASIAVPQEVAAVLLPSPETAALVCSGAVERGAASCAMQIVDPVSGTVHGAAPASALAVALDATSFVSIPFSVGAGTSGRLYLTSSRRRAFDGSDVEFLMQVAEQVLPMLEKVRVVDELAHGAAEEERRRIARDIHDAVVQPYVGFGLGLAAVKNELEHGREPEARAMLDRLLALTNEEVGGLRSYVSSLRGGESQGGGVLDAALRRFCARFSSMTGISVELDTALQVSLEPRIAGEVLQMVAEALSNVRRHTEAPAASVRVAAHPDGIVVDVENEPGPTPLPTAGFSPRSLTERAAALGGRVVVDGGGARRTSVHVSIPL